MAKKACFAIQIGAVDAEGASGQSMYREAIVDARYAQEFVAKDVFADERKKKGKKKQDACLGGPQY